jgi:phosphopantothenoylcysteine decarboxylase/phosphopantothenate--cysteine ligase
VAVHKVNSALEMLAAVNEAARDADLFIATAAVADYRVAQPASQKIKKDANTLSLELVPNPDILAQVAALSEGPFCVGFAAETENLQQHAQDKLQRKGLDMIAANDVSQAGRGFHAEDNELQLYWPGGQQTLALASKTRIAQQLIELIAKRMNNTEA